MDKSNSKKTKSNSQQIAEYAFGCLKKIIFTYTTFSELSVIDLKMQYETGFWSIFLLIYLPQKQLPPCYHHITCLQILQWQLLYPS